MLPALVRDSLVSCLVLVTVCTETVRQILGTLSPTMKLKLNDCPKWRSHCPSLGNTDQGEGGGLPSTMTAEVDARPAILVSRTITSLQEAPAT
jgi:hypothetical protein